MLERQYEGLLFNAFCNVDIDSNVLVTKERESIRMFPVFFLCGETASKAAHIDIQGLSVGCAYVSVRCLTQCR